MMVIYDVIDQEGCALCILGMEINEERCLPFYDK